jgi:glycosyltransferase involved in cell wall biosynthesis
VLLGDGPERERVERLLREESLTDAVHLPGFIQYDDLPTYYGLASAFVHVSTTEQWGLVVNEAMASRLPVIVSEQCGCSADLVSDANGFCVDAYDTDALTARMIDLTQASATTLETMGEASYSRIADWDPAFFADQLYQACEAARNTLPTSASVLDSFLLDRLAHR